jgi:dTDP-glucose 4,6-dehydratase
LIPLTILNALQNKPLPIYGDGMQIRDWLYVADHCSAIKTVLAEGVLGETYNVGANNERTNLELVKMICQILDRVRPNTQHASYASLIAHIQDRPGHDRRYAIDASKIEKELGWKPVEDFGSGLQKTVLWYLDNLAWIKNIQGGNIYQEWLTTQYQQVELS